ncbi:transcriptional repressor LexA [Candidatus Berkelbacteria bacterium]|nr:transcriptional repressor LexA [Candidatus Berkelbacteria bacterium]
MTPRQKAVFEFIKRHIVSKGYAPSFREIMAHFRLHSTATVSNFVKTLQKKGYLRAGRYEARSLQLTPLWDERHFEIPLMGQIAAGAPIEAIRTNETIEIPRDMMRPDVFALKVRGDSMIEDGIFSGDYVIVQKTETPKQGDIVVALLDNENATLKRFYKERSRVRLMPANKNYGPIYSRSVVVQGRVVGVIRKY